MNFQDPTDRTSAKAIIDHGSNGDMARADVLNAIAHFLDESRPPILLSDTFPRIALLECPVPGIGVATVCLSAKRLGEDPGFTTLYHVAQLFAQASEHARAVLVRPQS